MYSRPEGFGYKFLTSVSTRSGIISLLVPTRFSLFWVNCCVFFAMYLPSAHVFRREIICILFSLWQHYGHEEVHHSLTRLACALLCKGCKNRKYNLLLVQSFHPFDQLDLCSVWMLTDQYIFTDLYSHCLFKLICYYSWFKIPITMTKHCLDCSVFSFR